MEKIDKKELRKLIISKTLFLFGIYSGTVLLCASIKNCSKKTEDPSEEIINNESIYSYNENYQTNRYFSAPIKIIKEDGTTLYTAPLGWYLAYDEDGKPYCYQDRVEKNNVDSEAVSLIKKIR